MEKYLASSFSLGMLPEGGYLKIDRIELARLKLDCVNSGNYAKGHFAKAPSHWRNLAATSCIGHEGTALKLSQLLGVEVPCQRAEVNLRLGDILYVAQPQIYLSPLAWNFHTK